jgi:hypothetical protein
VKKILAPNDAAMYLTAAMNRVERQFPIEEKVDQWTDTHLFGNAEVDGNPVFDRAGLYGSTWPLPVQGSLGFVITRT